MALGVSPSQEQLSALKAAILADQALAPLAQTVTDGDLDVICAAFNTPDPTFVVWRSSVPVSEYKPLIDLSEIAAVTDVQLRVWNFITGDNKDPIHPIATGVTKALAMFDQVAPTTVASLLPVLMRKATRFERLFTTGTGTAQDPATMTVEGPLTRADVLNAINKG